MSKKKSATNTMSGEAYRQMAGRWFKSKVGPQDWDEEHFYIGGTKSFAASVDEQDCGVANLLRREEQKRAVFIKQWCSPDNPNEIVGKSIN